MREQRKVVTSVNPPKPSWESSGQSRQEARMMQRTKLEFDQERTQRPTQITQPGIYHTMYHEKYGVYGDSDLLSSNRDPDDYSKLSPLDPGGFAAFFTEQCKSLLDSKDMEFQGFLAETNRIEAYVWLQLDDASDQRKYESANSLFRMQPTLRLARTTKRKQCTLSPWSQSSFFR